MHLLSLTIKVKNLKTKNYSPISILLNFSEIYESVCTAYKKVFIRSQYTFQWTTWNQGSSFYNYMLYWLLLECDEEKFAVIVYQDMSEAFDLVDHKVLLTKLNKEFSSLIMLKK